MQASEWRCRENAVAKRMQRRFTTEGSQQTAFGTWDSAFRFRCPSDEGLFRLLLLAPDMKKAACPSGVDGSAAFTEDASEL